MRLEVGVTTSARLIRYSLCTACTQRHCVSVDSRAVRWCHLHTTFHHLSWFKGSQRTCSVQRGLQRVEQKTPPMHEDSTPMPYYGCVRRRVTKAMHGTFKKPEPWLSLGRAGKCALRRELRRTRLGELLSL